LAQVVALLREILKKKTKSNEIKVKTLFFVHSSFLNRPFFIFIVDGGFYEVK